MAAGWEVLKALPHAELSRLSDEQIARYLGAAEEPLRNAAARRS
jgi:hypothetical protein